MYTVSVKIPEYSDIRKFIKKYPDEVTSSIGKIAEIYAAEINKAAGKLRRSVGNFPKRDLRFKSLSGSFYVHSISRGRAKISSDVPYASVHDEPPGGTVKPAGKWMTVPIEGSKNITKGQLDAWKKSKHTFLRETKAGNLVIFYNPFAKTRGIDWRERRSNVVPIFVLKKKVKMQGQDYSAKGITKATPRVGRLLDKMWDNIFSKGA